MGVIITRSTGDDIADVIHFIDVHWKHNHALVTNRALLDWQHRDPDGGYSFVIARQNGNLVGILGFISTKRFDPTLAAQNVVWLTTWKVRDDAVIAGVGLALLRYLSAHEPNTGIGAIGLNPATTPIYQALGYRLGELHHYVLPNPDVNSFELATLTPALPPSRVDAAPLAARLLVTPADFERIGELPRSASTRVPRKSLRYFAARYGGHPVYSYRIAALMDGDRAVGLLAARLAEHDGRTALRVVDVIGDASVVARIGGVVRSLLGDHGAEYADVYNAGIDPAAFECAGFRCVDPGGSDVVPDHFEPFERRNVRLWFAIKTAGEPVLFKGDSDQDRPGRMQATP